MVKVTPQHQARKETAAAVDLGILLPLQSLEPECFSHHFYCHKESPVLSCTGFFLKLAPHLKTWETGQIGQTWVISWGEPGRRREWRERCLPLIRPSEQESLLNVEEGRPEDHTCPLRQDSALEAATKCCQIFWVVKRNRNVDFWVKFLYLNVNKLKTTTKSVGPTKLLLVSQGQKIRQNTWPFLLTFCLDFGPGGLRANQAGLSVWICDRHTLSSIISSRSGNALIKHQIVGMAGSEVTNKMTRERHLLLKSTREKGLLEFIPVSVGTNWALDTAPTAFISF